MICWMNGKYIESTELSVSPTDHGYLYGLGFFETFRTYNDKPFLWNEHCSRIQRALEEYRITMSYTFEELRDVIIELNKRNGQTDGYFRLNISAGEGGIGLSKTHYSNPNVIIFRKELPTASRGHEKNAVWLHTIRNSPEQAIRYKSHHYANNIRARFEVPSLKELEGFFVNAEGHIAEGITSNIFWAIKKELYTPSISTGILPGITRQHVLRLAHEVGLNIHEGKYRPQDLEKADECFITTSIQELIPIKKLDEKCFLGNTGDIYRQLHTMYIASIERE
ncbi:aminodeoxychorismate lyase [Rummeliibacillus suwonensis]|uniref:aminodeoxychorismate lyase n=1 Tax=Rummeliibacillus suwonensis TaxID=1306154 RepID=UPI00289969BE|nr:aminodeoxychorismate lyase [Rummeliibacillus suwonensis]